MSFKGQLGKAVAEANAAQSGTGQPAAGDTSVASTDLDSTSDVGTDLDNELVARAEESTSGDESLPVDAENTSEDSSEVPKDASPAGKTKEQANQKIPEREVITVTDEQGRRRRLEIDYSDRSKTKKAYELAAGARKWQAERDQAINENKQFKERQGSYGLLEKAWAERGEEGVVDLLAGRQGAYQEGLKKRMEREQFLKEASPEEVKALQDREANELSRKELEKLRKENEDFKKQVTEEREATELKAMESRVNPVFQKYRFAGRLGNETHEHRLDKMLWNDVLETLQPYEEQGIDITPELIEKEFATAARDIRQLIGKQADKKAARAVEQKKQEATENVQAAVMSKYTEGGVAKETRDMIQAGNTRGLLKNWSKVGKYFK